MATSDDGLALVIGPPDADGSRKIGTAFHVYLGEGDGRTGWFISTAHVLPTAQQALDAEFVIPTDSGAKVLKPEAALLLSSGVDHDVAGATGFVAADLVAVRFPPGSDMPSTIYVPPQAECEPGLDSPSSVCFIPGVMSLGLKAAEGETTASPASDASELPTVEARLASSCHSAELPIDFIRSAGVVHGLPYMEFKCDHLSFGTSGSPLFVREGGKRVVRGVVFAGHHSTGVVYATSATADGALFQLLGNWLDALDGSPELGNSNSDVSLVDVANVSWVWNRRSTTAGFPEYRCSLGTIFGIRPWRSETPWPEEPEPRADRLHEAPSEGAVPEGVVQFTKKSDLLLKLSDDFKWETPTIGSLEHGALEGVRQWACTQLETEGNFVKALRDFHRTVSRDSDTFAVLEKLRVNLKRDGGEVLRLHSTGSRDKIPHFTVRPTYGNNTVHIQVEVQGDSVKIVGATEKP